MVIFFEIFEIALLEYSVYATNLQKNSGERREKDIKN